MTTRRQQRTSARARQIAQVLVRHGLGYLVDVLGLERLVPFHKGLLKHPKRQQPYTRPEHVRMALEDLGATFIKLGQILSTRADLLPPDYQAEFAKLQDAAPTIPFAQVQATVEAELGQPLEALFATFDPVPLAAASIGQAHTATRRDGAEVVVKVRRPGVVDHIEADLTLLHRLAVTASQRSSLAAQYDLVALTEEFAQTLRAELDYVQEGHNAERVAANFAQDPTVHIPCIFWETTTARVLTLERIHGIKINDLAALDAAHIDRAVVAERAAKIILKMVFEDGFFHADPHPGNFLIEPQGAIGLIDYGMVGTVDPTTQDHLAQLLLALAGQDTDRLVDAFLDLGVTREAVDRLALRADLERLLAHSYSQPLGEIALGPLLNELLDLVRHHHLRLPTNLALLVKTTIMNEGLGMQLDPSFRLTSVIVPYAQRLLLKRASPLFWTKRMGRAGLDAAWLATELPQQVRRLLGELERGAVKIEMEVADAERFLTRLERLVNRLILAILTGALIIGLGMLMAFFHPPGGPQWVWVWFAAGFAIVALLGLYLAWSIFRPRRRSPR